MSKKRLSAAVVGLVFLLSFFASLYPIKVHASTESNGIIGSDTTWTKANSPYLLTGNVLIDEGVTLTIEAGNTVQLGNYYIMVNGTLNARGTMVDRIQFVGGSIAFTVQSGSWNETTGSGSIIENADLTTTSLSALSGPKISNCSILRISAGGSTLLINSKVTDSVSASDSSSILHNEINGGLNVNPLLNPPTVSYNTISGGLFVSGGSSTPEISHNDITGGASIGGPDLVFHNSISGGMHVSGALANVSFNAVEGGISCGADYSTFVNNTIKGAGIGFDITGSNGRTHISIINNTITAQTIGINIPEAFAYQILYGWAAIAYINGNIISGCSTAGIKVGEAGSQGGVAWEGNNVTITNNLLYANNYGIQTRGSGTIESNTIIDNTCGIDGYVTVSNNIIANNTIGINGGSDIKRNIVANNQVGISTSGRIENNTIINNALGIRMSDPRTLTFNNIYSNGLNLNYTSTSNLDAANNWWGTTNAQAINQSINDFKNDFNLGRVNFVPFLTASNPEATPESKPFTIPIPSPTQAPTQKPNQTPTSPNSPSPSAIQQQSESPTATPPTGESTPTSLLETYTRYVYGLIAVVIALIIVIIGLLVYFKKLRK